MLESFFKDVNRIAEAVETIAANGGVEKTPVEVTPAEVKVEKIEVLNSPTIVSVKEEETQAYEDMDRISLVAACRGKGVPVPKGTRDKTLVAKLKSYDAMLNSPFPAVSTILEETPTLEKDLITQEVVYAVETLTLKDDTAEEKQGTDPFEEYVAADTVLEETLISEEDIFDPLEDDTVPDHTKKYTLKEVREVMQKVMAQHGQGAVELILDVHGGVKRLKDLTESNFAKVVEASQKYSPKK